MARQTRYSDEDVARVIALVDANEGNTAETARQTGIPQRTIHHWTSDRTALVPDSQTVLPYKRALADRFEEEAHAALDHASRMRNRAEYRDSMVAAGIAVDKMRLLRDQPTEIVTSAEERDRLLTEILTRVLDRMNASEPGEPDAIPGTFEPEDVDSPEELLNPPSAP